MDGLGRAQRRDRAPFDRRLNLYLRTLIAEVATPDEPPTPVPVARRAAVRIAAVRLVLAVHAPDAAKPEVRASRSLWDNGLPNLEDWLADRPDGIAAAMSTGPKISGCGWSSARSISATMADIWSRWPATPPRYEETRPSTISSAAPSARSAVVLLLTTIFQVRFGLAPLKRISEAIARSAPAGRAARGRVPGRDRAAGARDQRADRRQPRDRRARAHPCRQSRACAQDAALGHRQRGDRAAATIRSPPRCASRPT